MGASAMTRWPDNPFLIDYLREVTGQPAPSRAAMVANAVLAPCWWMARHGCRAARWRPVWPVARSETIEGQTGMVCSRPCSVHFTRSWVRNAAFCTPGMIMASEALLRQNPHPDREIRAALGGNLCRCTGYVKIVDAVEEASRAGEIV